MLQFNSLGYAAFLATVVLLYWAIPRAGRRWLLLAVSYLFYATFDWRFCSLLAVTTGVHYTVGRRLGRTRNPEQRKVLLTLAIGFSLGVLGWFKYAGWLAEAITGVFGVDRSLAALVLPIGISYYTFHTLSYTIDVYRGEQEPTNDLLDFALFVAFFPQLLSGPLTRAKRMLPQFANLPRRSVQTQRIEGLELILIGLFQKVVLADGLLPITTAAFIDTTRGPTPDRSWLVLLLSAMAGFAQFVFDLTGYSNIARGSSKLLGIELPHNFRQPLTRSRNLADYWRRHHITLMAWLRDYAFRPLRSKLGTGPPAAYVTVVIVFVLSGLWHGASAGWLVWGAVIGILVATETVALRTLDRRRRQRQRRRNTDAGDVFPAGDPYALPLADQQDPTPMSLRRRTVGVLGQVRTSVSLLAILGLTIVLIRAPSLGAAAAYYREILRFEWVTLEGDTVGLLAFITAALIVVDIREATLERHEGTLDPPTVARIVLWVAMVVGILLFSGTSGQAFVYLGF